MSADFIRYYFLEEYLFNDVREHFRRDHQLNAFDLFSIVIWKANRAKSKIAKRLIERCGNIELAATSFTAALHDAGSPELRLSIATSEWKFRLPMASAILTVLWPEDFTIYDTRVCSQLVCSQLGNFEHLGDSSPIDWKGYCEFREAVQSAVPGQQSLRDKDRFLWGRSATRQLEEDIRSQFNLKPDPSLQ